MANRWGNNRNSERFYFWGSKITADGDYSHEIKRHLLLGRKVMTNLDIQKQRQYFANKGPSSQSYGFSSSHVWMWELDHKESRVPKNWCFWTVVLEKTLESLLDFKEIKPVHPKENQSWIFTGRTDAEAVAPIIWSLNAKNLLIGKNPDGGKDWRQEEKEMTEDEMVVWHHRLDVHEFEKLWELVMSSNHLILCHPLLLLPSIFPSIRVFSNESALRIRWPKYLSFSFNISSSNERPGLISFRMNWLNPLAVQRTLKSLLQHHSSKASILGAQLSL